MSADTAEKGQLKYTVCPLINTYAKFGHDATEYCKLMTNFLKLMLSTSVISLCYIRKWKYGLQWMNMESVNENNFFLPSIKSKRW